MIANWSYSTAKKSYSIESYYLNSKPMSLSYLTETKNCWTETKSYWTQNCCLSYSTAKKSYSIESLSCLILKNCCWIVNCYSNSILKNCCWIVSYLSCSILKSLNSTANLSWSWTETSWNSTSNLSWTAKNSNSTVKSWSWTQKNLSLTQKNCLKKTTETTSYSKIENYSNSKTRTKRNLTPHRTCRR